MRMSSVLTILISVLFILPMKTSAIGQVTEPIIIKNAQRGQEPQATLTIINNEKTETEIGLLAKGDISKWTNFYSTKDPKNPIQSTKIAAGQQAKIITRFSIPNDARNGKYKGYVSVSKKFSSSDFSKDQSSASVSQEIDREVTIEISGDEKIAFDVSVIPKTYDLQIGEPLDIRLIYDNRGNVGITPELQIKIRKDDKVFYNAIYPYPEDQPAIKPGEIYEIPAIQILTSNLDAGKYRSEMIFAIDSKTLQEKYFGFSVGIFARLDKDNDEVKNKSLATILSGFNFGGKNGNVLLAFAGMLIIYAFLKSKNRKLEALDNAKEKGNEKKISTPVTDSEEI